MNTPKKISVIVPSYNYAHLLEARLQSIQTQDYPIFELILLDDASTDNSLEIAKSFQEHTSLNMEIVLNRKNSGSVFKQWIKGIEMAKGDYIWIAEADDLSEVDFLSEAMKGFSDPDVVLSYTMSKVIDYNGNILQENYHSGTDDIDLDRWKEDYICEGEEEISNTFAIKNSIPNASSVVFKKIDLRPIRKKIEQFTVAGDWYFYYWLLMHGKIAFHHKALNLWRRHDNSVSARSRHHQSHYREIIELQELIYSNYSINNTVWGKALKHRERMRLWLHIYNEKIEKYIFIITYGESGSEKLLKYLNSIDTVEIRGENMGILANIYDTYLSVAKTQEFASIESKSTSHPWFGANNLDAQYFCNQLCDIFVNEVLKPSKDTKITGFKEIRFLNKTKTWLDAYVNFLFNFFPNSTVIFYHADIEKVAKTGFWKKQNYDALLPQLQYQDDWMQSCHLHYPDRSLQLFDDDFRRNPLSNEKFKTFIETELLYKLFDSMRSVKI